MLLERAAEGEAGAGPDGDGGGGGSASADGDGETVARDRRRFLHDVVDAYDDAGWTPLHMAIHQDFEAGVRLLLRYGATLSSKAQKCPYAGRFRPPGQTDVVDVPT
ncbi:hypothetical protein F4779DRAFT_623411 [Xylariaceae sp. FL0662B]|nr:hypothetical protein F4779DRAFT_623411 [Xylariaceae sp. FL0662B]